MPRKNSDSSLTGSSVSISSDLTKRLRHVALAFLFVFLLVGCSVATQQAQRPQQKQQQQKSAATPSPTPDDPAQYRTERNTSEPYTGNLDIFENEGRAEALQIDRVMDVLKIGDGSAVADIGAGSGWFTVRAARRVGARGTVYAVEINEEYIKYINDRAKRESLPNIKTVRGTEDDTRLPANSVNAVLILKTYHEIAEPVLVMRRLRASLKPNALVGIIDRNGSGTDHGIERDVVVKEMERAGYALVEEHDFVKDGMDYLLVFTPNK